MVCPGQASSGAATDGIPSRTDIGHSIECRPYASQALSMVPMWTRWHTGTFRRMQDVRGIMLDLHPTITAFPSGVLRHYDLSPHGVVLVEEKTGEVVISWTTNISAAAFLNICRSLGGGINKLPYGSSSAIISAGATRFSGDGSTVLRDCATLPVHRLQDCDFIRLDLPPTSIAYHDFEIGAPALRNRRIVSWAGAALDSPALTTLIREAATPFVGKRAWTLAQSGPLAVWPAERVAAPESTAEIVPAQTLDRFFQSPPRSLPGWEELLPDEPEVGL